MSECLRRLVTVTTKDFLHPILQLQLPLLQLDLFEMFRFLQIRLGGKFVEAIVELAVLGGELSELFVILQQEFLQLLGVCGHSPPPCSGSVGA